LIGLWASRALLTSQLHKERVIDKFRRTELVQMV